MTSTITPILAWRSSMSSKAASQRPSANIALDSKPILETSSLSPPCSASRAALLNKSLMQEAERLPNAEIERRLLSALCATTIDHEMRALILERLSAHTFANRDHEIIFQALTKIPLAPA